MTPALLALSRQLAALPGFRWAPGMLGLSDDAARPPLRVLTVESDGELWVSRGGDHVYLRSVWWWSVNYGIPDLTDPATGGVLLNLIPRNHRHRVSILPGGLYKATIRDLGRMGDSIGPHLAEACARVLVALGRVG